MNIGLVLDDRIDKTDGVHQYVLLLGSWLAQRGHNVHYLTGYSPHASQPNVHHFSKTIRVRFNRNRMEIPLPASKKQIKTLLRNQPYDILHVQAPYSPLLAGKIVQLADPTTAVIGTFHILPHGSLSSAGTKALARVVNNTNRRFAGFISVSSAAQSFAQSHFGVSSVVLPNVVDVSLFQNAKPMHRYTDKKNIVFLGRLVTRKGASYLLRAYKILLREHPEHRSVSRLIICGDGSERKKLEKIASSMRKDGADIVFTGYVTEVEKRDYLATADLAVFPATGGESFGIVLIEAMAAGAGVVLGGNNDGYTTVLGSTAEIYDVLFDPKKPLELSHKLHTLLTDASLRRRLHEFQQLVVKDYDIQNVGPLIEQFYKDALRRSR